MIKRLAHCIHSEGKHFALHVFALACLLLGVFIIGTASDMGPFAPLLISCGIYLCVFALLVEGMFWGMALLRRVAARWVHS